eukprot:3676697-Rhodomonas_salina.3
MGSSCSVLRHPLPCVSSARTAKTSSLVSRRFLCFSSLSVLHRGNADLLGARSGAGIRQRQMGVGPAGRTGGRGFLMTEAMANARGLHRKTTGDCGHDDHNDDAYTGHPRAAKAAKKASESSPSSRMVQVCARAEVLQASFRRADGSAGPLLESIASDTLCRAIERRCARCDAPLRHSSRDADVSGASLWRYGVSALPGTAGKLRRASLRVQVVPSAAPAQAPRGQNGGILAHAQP